MKKALFFTIVLFEVLFAQAPVNSKLFSDIIEKSTNTILKNLPSAVDTIYISVESSSELRAVHSRVLKSFQNNGKTIFVGTSDTHWNISYTLENITVKYGEAFRKSFWSAYETERSCSLNSTWLLRNKLEVIAAKSFTDEITDTIKLDYIEEAEQNSYPFPKGNTPGEPVFSSLIEPVVAVTATVITVYMFFNVRSK